MIGKFSHLIFCPKLSAGHSGVELDFPTPPVSTVLGDFYIRSSSSVPSYLHSLFSSVGFIGSVYT